MHNGQTHEYQHVVGQRLWITVLLIFCSVHHPLQEIVWSAVARVIGCICSATLVDYWDEQVLREADLALHLSHGWKEGGYEGAEEVWEWTEEKDCDASVCSVAACCVEPLFVVAEGFAGDDARGCSCDELAEQLVGLDCCPFAC